MSEEKTLVKQESSLEDFKWNQNEDWFGVKSEPSGVENTIEKAPEIKEPVKKTLPEESVKKQEEQEDDDLDISFFETAPKKSQKDPDDEDDDPSEAEEDILPAKPDEGSVDLTDLAMDLKERGILNFEIGDKEKIDEDKFFELQNNEIQAGIDSFVESFIDALKSDEEAAAFIRFKKEGGTTEEFLRTYAPVSQMPVNLDITDESNQERVARYIIRNLEHTQDEDDIQSRIEYLKENGKLEAFSKKGQNRLKEMKKKQEETLVKSQAEQRARQEQSRKEFQTVLKRTAEKDSLLDIPITDEERKVLPSFISEPTVKMGDRYVPRLHASISEILTGKDPEKLLLLGKILYNDFKMDSIKRKAKTELVKESRVAAGIKGKPHSSSAGIAAKGRDLASNFWSRNPG
jgi:hypothetical protein